MSYQCHLQECSPCVQKGMSLPDFEEYQRRKPDLAARTPYNVLDISGVLPPSSTDDRSSPSTPLRSVPADRLAQMLKDAHEQHVLYISDLFSVIQGRMSGDAESTCVPNCDYEAMRPGLQQALKRFESIDGCHPFHGHLTTK
jgi:hypothetical protein